MQVLIQYIGVIIKMKKMRRIRQIVVVFVVFILYMLSMGISQSFGIIYKELLTAFEVTESEIGWIPSLFSGLLLGTGKWCSLSLNIF